MKKFKLKTSVPFKLKSRASLSTPFSKIVVHTAEKVFIKLKTDTGDYVWNVTVALYLNITADIQKSIIKKPTFLTKIKKVVNSLLKWFKK